MTETTEAVAPTDDSLRELITGLARPHRGGGQVIERASLLASGADFHAAMAWIDAHGGGPETLPTATPARGGGLHGARHTVPATEPLRYILPPGALR